MIELYQHQRKAVEIAREKKRFGFFWKPGTGKTIGILSIQEDRPKRTLVVAQRSIIETAWLDDAELLGLDAFSIMNPNKRKRVAGFNIGGPDSIIITNYEQFRIHYEEILRTGVERIVFDESSKLKNPDAKVTKAAIAASDQVDEVYLLSGTPAPNNPTEFWSQLRCLSIKASGRTFRTFANHFFFPDYEWVRIRGGKVKKVIKGWSFKTGAEPIFHEHLREWSWALPKEACLDLPATTDVVRLCELSQTERKVYEGIRDEARLEVLEDGVMKVRSVHGSGVTMKLRQATGGGVKISDNQVQRFGKSKITEVSEWLDELGPDEPVLIWAEFTDQINRLVEMINARGETVDIIDGRTRNVKDTVQRFQDGTVKRIVAQPQAAGHGTDGLQKICNHAGFFSMSFSPEFHEQAKSRLDRAGQTKPVTFTYFISPETIDEGILETVTGKVTASEALLAELKRDF